MEQDLRTCPGCGAPSSNHPSCPYCSWTPELSEEPNLKADESVGSPSATDLPDDLQAPAAEMLIDADLEDFPGTEIESVSLPEAQEKIDDEGLPVAEGSVETDPAQFRELLKPGSDPEHLLDQVPEEMRGVLAARLKAAEETDSPVISEATAATLREKGFIVSEDVHGARLSAIPGQSAELSASDVVKMAADLDGGVQPQTKLPICSNCQAASPIGETQCQWCGEPFSDEQ